MVDEMLPDERQVYYRRKHKGALSARNSVATWNSAMTAPT